MVFNIRIQHVIETIRNETFYYICFEGVCLTTVILVLARVKRGRELRLLRHFAPIRRCRDCGTDFRQFTFCAQVSQTLQIIIVMQTDVRF